MISGSPDFGARTTRSAVRAVEASNLQQTSYFGNHEKAPVSRGGSDRAERETVRQRRLALRGEASARAEESTTSRLEKVSSRRDQGIGDGTEHPSLWSRWQGTCEGTVNSRLAALVRETARNGSIAIQAADVPVASKIGSAQSTVTSLCARRSVTSNQTTL